MPAAITLSSEAIEIIKAVIKEALAENGKAVREALAENGKAVREALAENGKSFLFSSVPSSIFAFLFHM